MSKPSLRALRRNPKYGHHSSGWLRRLRSLSYGRQVAPRNDGKFGEFAMSFPKRVTLAVLLLSGSLLSARAAETPLPDAIAAPGETVVLSVHAEGAQVYECKAGADGKSTWVFREPVAKLMADGKIVGRHDAGPTWQHNDGS